MIDSCKYCIGNFTLHQHPPYRKVEAMQRIFSKHITFCCNLLSIYRLTRREPKPLCCLLFLAFSVVLINSCADTEHWELFIEQKSIKLGIQFQCCCILQKNKYGICQHVFLLQNLIYKTEAAPPCLLSLFLLGDITKLQASLTQTTGIPAPLMHLIDHLKTKCCLKMWGHGDISAMCVQTIHLTM